MFIYLDAGALYDIVYYIPWYIMVFVFVFLFKKSNFILKLFNAV